ncbi:kinase-like protein [Schizopora paradoxa]|uniref:Kinase-like protein n=1 Tax=Schizopora paradoxa TaxID=27342 RepID=A0A0H2S359_9AGAM|nr:kinase-like protein [Schizopora paradoxa]
MGDIEGRREELNRRLLEDVLKKLPNHNLEGRIECQSQPTLSIGGCSDIYLGSFKTDVLPILSKLLKCTICRSPKEKMHETTCNRCMSIWNGKLAVKKIRGHLHDENHSKAIARELYVFSKLSHPNVLPLTGFFILDCFPAIVTPWVENGSLYDQNRSKNMSRSEENVLNIVIGIARGLAYLHKQDVLHCDLKSNNIFLSMDNTPLLADFGHSRIISSEVSIVISNSDASLATVRWAAPELFDSNSQYSKATDVWAFGMVLYEVVTLKLPYFEETASFPIMRRIDTGQHPEWVAKDTTRTSTRLHKLCKKCWSKNPTDRPTMQAIVLSLPSRSPKESKSPSQSASTDRTSIRTPATSTSVQPRPGPSGNQVGARNQTQYPCDHCVRERRKCELRDGVPCVRCAATGRACTVDGKTKEFNRDLLFKENGDKHPFLYARIGGEGQLALLITNGNFHLQHVTPHFVKIGVPKPVGPQVRVHTSL